MLRLQIRFQNIWKNSHEQGVGGEDDDRVSNPYNYNAEKNKVGHPIGLL